MSHLKRKFEKEVAVFPLKLHWPSPMLTLPSQEYRL